MIQEEENEKILFKGQKIYSNSDVEKKLEKITEKFGFKLKSRDQRPLDKKDPNYETFKFSFINKVCDLVDLNKGKTRYEQVINKL